MTTTEMIVRVTEGGAHRWTGTVEDLLENCGELPEDTVVALTGLAPGASLEVNGFTVKHLAEAKVPRLSREDEEDEEETALERAQQSLMHGLKVMQTAATQVQDVLRGDLGPADVRPMREVLEETANTLLGVGSELADIEVGAD